MSTTTTLSPAELHEILVTDIGIDREALSEQPEAALGDLGLDSMATVELGVVLRAHGVDRKLPADTHDMSFIELVGQLCAVNS